MKELICIVCPKGCRLRVDEEDGYAVTGQGCPRGEAYAKAELTHPTRVLTTTVRVEGGVHRRCPVRTDGPIPKDQMTALMRQLDGITLRAPVAAGQAVLRQVCGTGCSVIATPGYGSGKAILKKRRGAVLRRAASLGTPSCCTGNKALNRVVYHGNHHSCRQQFYTAV